MILELEEQIDRVSASTSIVPFDSQEAEPLYRELAIFVNRFGRPVDSRDVGLLWMTIDERKRSIRNYDPSLLESAAEHANRLLREDR